MTARFRKRKASAANQALEPTPGVLSSCAVRFGSVMGFLSGVAQLGSFGGLFFELIAFAVGTAEALNLTMIVANAKVSTAETVEEAVSFATFREWRIVRIFHPAPARFHVGFASHVRPRTMRCSEPGFCVLFIGHEVQVCSASRWPGR